MQILINRGWRLGERDTGDIWYRPLGDKEEHDWQTTNIGSDDLMLVLKKKEQLVEPIGVVMTWQDTNIGGSFTFDYDGSLQFNIDLYRKIIDEQARPNITDVNWYLDKLLPFFVQEGLGVLEYIFDEYR